MCVGNSKNFNVLPRLVAGPIKKDHFCGSPSSLLTLTYVLMGKHRLEPLVSVDYSIPQSFVTGWDEIAERYKGGRDTGIDGQGIFHRGTWRSRLVTYSKWSL